MGNQTLITMSNLNPEGDFLPLSLLIMPSDEQSGDSYTKINQLSARELDICYLLSQGLNSKEIAHQLNLSEHTVSTHRKKIIKKTNCRNTVHLIALCLRQGII